MNEADARTVLLVQAVETADTEGRLLPPAQRQQASEVVRAGLPAPGRTLRPSDWAEQFLLRRAQRLLQEAAARRPALQALAEPPRAAGLVAALVVLGAFGAGLASDALANPGRINLLSLPLLAVVGWNAALALLWLLSRPLVRRRRRSGGWAAALSGWLAWPARWRSGGVAVAGAFGRAWARTGAPLLAARVRAVLHCAAAAAALGLLAYVYLRALPNEFHVGWESQLLRTPEQAHAFLRLLFLPLVPLSAVLPGLQPFTLDEVTQLQHWATTDAALADRWLRLVTALLLAVVVVPRLLLALLARRRARRLARRFPLDLADPYFARLLADGTGLRHRLVVWPYSVTPDAARLPAQARAALGTDTALDLRPATAYGAAPEAPSRTSAAPGELTEVAALMSLSATPEAETHGAFLQRVVQVAGGHAMLLLDAAAFAQRLGGGERLRERSALWSEFAQRHGVARVHVLMPEDADA